MTNAPLAPPGDDKDWTWVLDAPCPDCGFDAASIERGEIPARTRTAMAGFAAALAREGAAARPAPDVWSPLEYACHTRDVCRTFDGRLTLMLEQDDPVFPNWDQDRTALENRYWEQDPSAVAAECITAGDVIAARFESISGTQWDRRGRRSNGSVFTVESIGRYFVHDLVHHLHDIGT